MRFKNHILNEGTSTKETTFYHEVGCAIYCVDKNAKLRTGRDIAKYIASKKVLAMDPSLRPLSVDDLESSVHGVFLTDEPIPNQYHKVLKDAKIIADRLISIVGRPTQTWWTGPTNDATRLGAADIVMIVKGEERPVSLKFGAGQLKNLGLNKIGGILFKGILPKNRDFLSVLDDVEYSKYWDGMTQDWLTFLYEDGLKALGPYLKYSWDDYQKAKLSEQEAESFEAFIERKPNELHLKVLCKKYYSEIKNTKKWHKIKEFWFDKIFNGFFENNKDEVNKNLKDFFKAQLSVGDTEMWYAADGGKKILFIPSESSLESISNQLLKFKFSSKASTDGYVIELTVSENATGKVVGIITIDVSVRWKSGQMTGKPSSSSKMKLLIEPKEWNEIFHKGNMTLT